MKTIRVWFNHWFSTAYHIINLIKQDDETKFYVIGTSSNPDSVVRLSCDEWYYEDPHLSDDEYINFCLKFCEQHCIDVFVPRHNQLSVSRHKKDFENINVKVMADDFSLISDLHDKVATYNFLSANSIGLVPQYASAQSAEEFISAYKNLSGSYSRLCCKFAEDEGAISFRIIDDNIASDCSVFRTSGRHMSSTMIADALAQTIKCPKIIIMPFLSGNEVSVDCLRTTSGTIMIPRFKGNTRTEYIRYDQTILDTCCELYSKLPLEMPCNIQFRYLDDKPYFLEINTRMSGGIHMTSMASGVNIPNIAINKLIGIEKPWDLVKEDKKISQIEQPVLMP
ncbi:MAG: ATP-grasp domain-containing protein [Oscillospiraceae bacterium]|nr:ATP-grasp domain-containing protein [Oscillospiraceae bacterium]